MDHVTPIVESAYQILLSGITSGRWGDRLPSERKLAAELKVARMTLAKALRRLEEEGHLLKDEATGVRHVAHAARRKVAQKRSLRVGVFVPVSQDAEEPAWVGQRINMMRRIEDMGHTCVTLHHACTAETPKIARMAKLVESACADAWIIIGGPRSILEWFDAYRKVPSLAYGGYTEGLERLSICCSALYKGTLDAVHALLELGHQRIVNIVEARYSKPVPSPLLLQIEDKLTEAGIHVGEYHIPDWEETPQGLESLLDSLFRLTPPTALVVWDELAFIGVYAYLGRKGLRIPDDVSLVVLGYLPMFEWLLPCRKLAHLKHDWVRIDGHVQRWIKLVAAGNTKQQRYIEHSEFVSGDTVAAL